LAAFLLLGQEEGGFLTMVLRIGFKRSELLLKITGALDFAHRPEF
jgi:hypothetical protein